MTPKELKAAYQRGENLTQILRRSGLESAEAGELVELVYDLQAGQYVKAMESERWRKFRLLSGENIARELTGLTAVGSLLEPGIGEGTTFSSVVANLPERPASLHGFDLSWSRIAHARGWLHGCGLGETFLSVAHLLRMPYADNSFDVVFTSHAVEPNGGKEEAILTELYRVTSRYLVMVEPDDALADEEGRQRMQDLGYCHDLVGVAHKLGYKVVKHQRFEPTVNPKNPSSLTVIEKNPSAPPAQPSMVCPLFREPLERRPDAYFSPGSMRAYPLLSGIPCLRPGDGVVASAFDQFPSKSNGR